MTSMQTTTTAAGAVPAARGAPDDRTPSRSPARRSRWAPRPASGSASPGRTSRSPPVSPTGVMLCLFDEAGAETPIPLRDNDADVWHAFVPGSRPGTGLRVPRRRPLGSGPRPAVQPGQAAARPVRQGHQRIGLVRARGARPGRGRPRQAEQPDSAAHVPRSLVVRRRSSAGRTTAGPAPRTPTRSSTRCTSRASPCAIPGVPPAAARHLRRPGPRGRHRPPARPRRDRRRAAAGARERARGVPGPARADQLLGLQHDRLLRPAPGYSAAVRAGQPGGQVAEFKAMVDALHAAGLEVILDVVFNHTAESDHTGPTLCFRGLDNPAYYRLEPGDPRRLRRHDRLRQLAERGRPAHASADHGLAALLADRDARRRLPVRPGPHAGPPGRAASSKRVGVLRPGSRRTRWCRGPS